MQPEWRSGNLFIRPHLMLEAGIGGKICGHYHNHDHNSIVHDGAVHVLSKIPAGGAIIAASRWGRARSAWHTMESAREQIEELTNLYGRELNTALLEGMRIEAAHLESKTQDLKALFDEALLVGDYVEQEQVLSHKYGKRKHVLIRAFVAHEITPLEPYTEFWCVYSHQNAQGRIVEEYTGWPESYT